MRSKTTTSGNKDYGKAVEGKMNWVEVLAWILIPIALAPAIFGWGVPLIVWMRKLGGSFIVWLNE